MIWHKRKIIMHKHGHKVISVVQGKNSNSYMEVFKFLLQFLNLNVKDNKH